MIYQYLEQRSPEWFELRKGRVTASRFSDILTSTGKPSAKQKDYINDLVAEEFSVEPLEYYQNDAMLRGIELEPAARSSYQQHQQMTVAEVAFITHDSLPLGCSPDGVISSPSFEIRLEDIQGGVELKSPGHKNHVKWAREGRCPPEYYPQVMGTIFICEVDWWDFYSYHPGMEPKYQGFHFRVGRDDKWISAFESEVSLFAEQLETAKHEFESRFCG